MRAVGLHQVDLGAEVEHVVELQDLWDSQLAADADEAAAGTGQVLRVNELEAVLGHELTHIRNRDVRLLIVSIIFVGIFSFAAQMILNNMIWGRHSNNNDSSKVPAIFIALGLAAVGYFFALLTRFSLSRAREFLADAGSANLTGKPQSLISALRKLSKDPQIETVKRADIAQLFIEHPTGAKSFFTNTFAPHTPTKERITELGKL